MLSDLGEVKGGLTLGKKRQPGERLRDVPYLRVANVQRGRLDLAEIKLVAATEREIDDLRLKPGDVLMNEGGDRDKLGRGWVWSGEIPECIHQNHVFRVRVFEGIAPRFVSHYANSAGQDHFQGSGRQTTNLASVNKSTLSALPLPLPPQNEQRRIVAKLDAIFEQTRAAKAGLERLPALLEKLKRSILAAAFHGDLTADWRAAHPDVEPASVLLDRIRTERRRRWEADLCAKGKEPAKMKYEEPAQVDAEGLPELPRGWTWANIGTLASVFQYGTSAKTSEAGAVPVLRMGNIADGELSLDDLKFLPADHDEFPELLLESGDLVFNRTNSPELVGKTAVFRGTPSVCSFASYLIRVRIELIDSRWVSLYINSPAGRDWVRSVVAQQVGQANVNGSKLKALAVPVPPAGEIEFALSIIEEALATRRMLVHRAASVAASMVRVEQAALAKAFRGELVPQDPNDEPAAVLLDRIRAARANAPQSLGRGRDQRPAGAPTTGRKSNGHSTSTSRDDSLDLVVAALQQGEPRLTAADIAEATNLDAPAVKQVLKALVAAGQVRVHGKARGTAYEWIA